MSIWAGESNWMEKLQPPWMWPLCVWDGGSNRMENLQPPWPWPLCVRAGGSNWMESLQPPWPWTHMAAFTTEIRFLMTEFELLTVYRFFFIGAKYILWNLKILCIWAKYFFCKRQKSTGIQIWAYYVHCWHTFVDTSLVDSLGGGYIFLALSIYYKSSTYNTIVVTTLAVQTKSLHYRGYHL